MKTIEWEENKLKLIDQTKLPDELTYVYCENYHEVIVAIRDMIVRGAPAIGVAAAFGMALAYLNDDDLDMAGDEIKAARPTAINLFWAVDRVLNSENPLDEALKMYREDIDTNRAIGKYGSEIIDDGDTVLTEKEIDEAINFAISAPQIKNAITEKDKELIRKRIFP